MSLREADPDLMDQYEIISMGYSHMGEGGGLETGEGGVESEEGGCRRERTVGNWMSEIEGR